MDSSISHDPFAPDSTTFASFRDDRWRRAGATEEEVGQLSEAFDQMAPLDRNAEARAIDSVSDIDLQEALDRQRQAAEFVGFRAVPVPVPEIEDEEKEPEEPEQEQESEVETDELGALEAEAIAGKWYPSNAYLTVGEEQYRISNLVNGFIGVRIGDEITGKHVVAKGEPALQAALEAALAEE
jgi:hypothetical protein